MHSLEVKNSFIQEYIWIIKQIRSDMFSNRGKSSVNGIYAEKYGQFYSRHFSSSNLVYDGYWRG